MPHMRTNAENRVLPFTSAYFHIDAAVGPVIGIMEPRRSVR